MRISFKIISEHKETNTSSLIIFKNKFKNAKNNIEVILHYESL